MEIKELLKSKRAEIIRITEKYGARNVRLFGSVARGEYDQASDIDLLVEFGPGVTLLKHAAMIRELELLLGVKTDVVSDRALRARIRDRVLDEAVPI